jgi:hypothetical protein
MRPSATFRASRRRGNPPAASRRALVPDLGARLRRPYRVRARIEPFQVLAAPFAGELSTRSATASADQTRRDDRREVFLSSKSRLARAPSGFAAPSRPEMSFQILPFLASNRALSRSCRRLTGQNSFPFRWRKIGFDRSPYARRSDRSSAAATSAMASARPVTHLLLQDRMRTKMEQTRRAGKQLPAFFGGHG